MSPALYTSYWNSPLLPEVDAVKVSISRGDPRRRLPFRYRKTWRLCPSRETFALRGNDEFEESYLGELEAVGIEVIEEELERISSEHGGKPLILLCHEKSRTECHRDTFARWYEQETCQRVPELSTGDLPEAPDVVQPTLL